MSNRQPEEKRTRRRALPEAELPLEARVKAPTPVKPTKLARGTRDSLEPIQARPAVRESERDDELDTDELKLVDAPDTVVIDPDDPTISGDAIDALDLSGDAESIDAH